MAKPQWDAGYVPATSVKELLDYFEGEIQKQHASKSAVHSKRLGSSRRLQQCCVKPCCEERCLPSSQLQQAWQQLGSETSPLTACSKSRSEANRCMEASAQVLNGVQSYVQRPLSSDKTSVYKVRSFGTPCRVLQVAKRADPPVRQHDRGMPRSSIDALVSSGLFPRVANDGQWLLSNMQMGFKSEPLEASPTARRQGLQYKTPYTPVSLDPKVTHRIIPKTHAIKRGMQHLGQRPGQSPMHRIQDLQHDTGTGKRRRHDSAALLVIDRYHVQHVRSPLSQQPIRNAMRCSSPRLFFGSRNEKTIPPKRGGFATSLPLLQQAR